MNESASIGLRKQVESYIFDSILNPIQWPELRAYVEYWFGNRAGVLGDLFPLDACRSAGGTCQTAIPIAAYYWLAILAARMLDDWQDGEGEAHPWHNHPELPLLAVGLLGAAQSTLAAIPAQHIATITSNFGRVLSLGAKAQLIEIDKLDLSAYLQHSISATGIVWSTVGWAGALLGSSNDIGPQLVKDIGFQIGMADAIFDDLSDLKIDLAHRKYTLPVQYAFTLKEHSLYTDFLNVINDHNGLVHTDTWLALLNEMGAISYALGVAHNYQEKARALIAKLPRASSHYLTPYAKCPV